MLLQLPCDDDLQTPCSCVGSRAAGATAVLIALLGVCQRRRPFDLLEL